MRRIVARPRSSLTWLGQGAEMIDACPYGRLAAVHQRTNTFRRACLSLACSLVDGVAGIDRARLRRESVSDTVRRFWSGLLSQWVMETVICTAVFDQTQAIACNIAARL